MKAEGTFDVQHVADTIVHIAGLPLDVTVLNFNILCVLVLCCCQVLTDPSRSRATTMPFVGRG